MHEQNKEILKGWFGPLSAIQKESSLAEASRHTFRCLAIAIRFNKDSRGIDAGNGFYVDLSEQMETVEDPLGEKIKKVLQSYEN